MEKEKTNFDFLKELIKGNEEALEFLEAIEKESSGLKEKNKFLENENSNKTEHIFELRKKVNSGVFSKKISFGIGEVYYRTDNLALQSFMEELKEKYEKQANFGQLKLEV